jgi:hypothetical protein
MAFGVGTINAAGGAVGDLFAAEGYKYKARGLEFEKANYLEAANMAAKNAEFTDISTGIKVMQTDRDIYKSMGRTSADVAGAGFALSGSALDILADEAQQGNLVRSVTQQQGIIDAEAYRVQQKADENMAAAADVAIDAAHTAEIGSYISSGFKAAASVASFFV